MPATAGRSRPTGRSASVAEVNLDEVRRDDWVVGGVAVVLAFDLLVLPWFSLPLASLTIGGTTVAFGGGSLTATGTPDGWLGIFAVLALIALVVELALERLSPETHVPVLGSNRATTRYVLALAASACLAFKFILHLGQFGNLGIGFWFGAVLAGGLVYVTSQARHAVAGVPPKRTASASPRGTAGPPTV